MYKNRKYFVILMPSLLSLLSSLLLSVGIVVGIGLSYSGGKGTIYNYLFGPDSSAELISGSESTLSALNNTVLGNAILNKILYFAFWMAVGLVVYIVLYALLKGTGAASEDLKEVTYANIKRERILQDFAIKIAVRVAAVFGWIVFAIIFVKMLLPFCSLATRAATSDIWSTIGIAYLISAILVLILSFHIEVVLTRFVFLKVRLFSQQEVEE